MKILFLTMGHVSKLRGGVDKVTDTLALNFIQKGHDVLMMSVWKPVPGDKIESYQHFLPSQEIDSQTNVTYLKSFLTENRVDVIVNQSEPIRLMNLIVSSHGSIPIVSVIHTDPQAALKAINDTWDKWMYEQGKSRFILKYPYYFLRRLYQRKTRRQFLKDKYSFYYEQCAAIVLLSERFKESFKEIAGLSNEEKLFAISNPMSTDILGNHCEKEKLILFVGRLEFSPKRLDRLFKVWTQIKDKTGWKIKILGDGEEREFYERYVKELHINNVEFLGTVTPVSYYNKASILCVTSSHEGFSLAILEALQNDVIPVAFDSYEAVHDLIIDGYNGYIVPAFSIKGYRIALENLISNEDLRKTMRKNIKEKNRRNEFNGDVIADKWIHLFEKLVKN